MKSVIALCLLICFASSASAQSLFDLFEPQPRYQPRYQQQYPQQQQPQTQPQLMKPSGVVAFNSQYTPDQIIVSFSDRKLYYVLREGEAISYPIATPRPEDRWSGTMKITAKKENPSWTPTKTMLEDNPDLPQSLPGGHPWNPMGVRALYLGSSLYRIHGTPSPATIGQAISKGCIRMYNRDVMDLYGRVSVGTNVTITWERFANQG